jgi:hypothetical protein
MKKFFVCLIIALFLVACGTAPKPKQIQNAFQIDKPFDSVWPAVIETFADFVFPISKMEKASGLIATDLIRLPGTYDTFDKDNETGYCDCGGPAISWGTIIRAVRLRVFVRKTNETSCEVTINAKFDVTWERDFESRSYECVSNGKLEAEMFKRISEKVAK